MLHLTAHSIFSHILSIQFSHNQNAPNREPPTWYVQRPMRERVQCLCFEQQYIWFDSTLLTYTRYFAQSGEKHLLCRSYISPISILAIGSVLFNCISCVFFSFLHFCGLQAIQVVVLSFARTLSRHFFAYFDQCRSSCLSISYWHEFTGSYQVCV